ncbi:hypothetical protein ACSBR1_026494 [Camellia fascicularis]
MDGINTFQRYVGPFRISWRKNIKKSSSPSSTLQSSSSSSSSSILQLSSSSSDPPLPGGEGGSSSQIFFLVILGLGVHHLRCPMHKVLTQFQHVLGALQILARHSFLSTLEFSKYVFAYYLVEMRLF